MKFPFPFFFFFEIQGFQDTLACLFLEIKGAQASTFIPKRSIIVSRIIVITEPFKHKSLVPLLVRSVGSNVI